MKSATLARRRVEELCKARGFTRGVWEGLEFAVRNDALERTFVRYEMNIEQTRIRLSVPLVFGHMEDLRGMIVSIHKAITGCTRSHLQRVKDKRPLK